MTTQTPTTPNSSPATPAADPTLEGFTPEQLEILQAVRAKKGIAPPAAPETPPQTPPAEPPQTPSTGKKIDLMQEAKAPAEESDDINDAFLDAAYKEFSEKGMVSEDHMKKLTSAKPKAEIVKTMFEMRKELDTLRKTVADDIPATIAGGQKNLDTLISWAQTNLSPEEKMLYNSALNSGNPQGVKAAMVAIKARHDAASGANYQGRFPKVDSNPASNRFQNEAEYHEALRNVENLPAAQRNLAYQTIAQKKSLGYSS